MLAAARCVRSASAHARLALSHHPHGDDRLMHSSRDCSSASFFSLSCGYLCLIWRSSMHQNVIDLPTMNRDDLMVRLPRSSRSSRPDAHTGQHRELRDYDNRPREQRGHLRGGCWLVRLPVVFLFLLVSAVFFKQAGLQTKSR
jgi:hypothetical protein